jgi:hypothetical protein
MSRQLAGVTATDAFESLLIPDRTGLLFMNRFGTDATASRLNWKDGTTTAVEEGAPTYGTGNMAYVGNPTGHKGMDMGFAPTGRDVFIAALVDPAASGSGGILASTGIPASSLLAGMARVWLDGNPADGDTITINGQAITFKAAGAVGFQVLIGATSLETAASLRDLINANPSTFLVTAHSPSGNSVLTLTATTTGLATNNITVVESSSVMRITNTALTSASQLSSGSDGETVTLGLTQSGSAFVMRNSNLGAGGLPSIAYPGAGYYVVMGWGTLRDFARLQVYASNALSEVAMGGTTGAGRAWRSSANLKVADAAFGNGLGNISLAACWERIPGSDERLELAKRWKVYGTAQGLTVG